MGRKDEQPTARVQVYFENHKVEQALRREARTAKIPLSRAAERAISRGLVKRPGADPEDRLLNLERAFRDVQGARFHPLREKEQHRFTGRVALGLDIDA